MKPNGLPKSSLLRKTWEFNLVYKKGTRIRGKGFTLIGMPNGLEFSRIGISVHRKIKGSVRRNRIKRIVRESFRLHKKVYPDSMDLVFTVNPHFRFTNPETISKAVGALVSTDIQRQHDGQPQ